MNLNDEIEVNIIDDNHNGVGIGKVNEKPLFIEKAVKDDIVKVKITEINKKYLTGEVIEYIKQQKREEIKCPYYDKCGGCNLLHITKEKENKLKEDYIKKLFKKDVCITTLDRLGYRNKVTFHIKDNKLGFYKDKTNDLIEIKKCLLLNEDINNIIPLLEEINKKDINEITIKKGTNSLLIDIKGKINNKDLLKLITSKKIDSIYENDKLIYGDEYIKYNLGKYTYLGNNNSFFQVNNKIAEKLYDKVKEYVKDAKNLLDLYCGTATIGIYLENVCKNITGIEINKDSVKCGKQNIKLNNIKNYEIFNKDAKDIENNFDVIVVDPPRSGLSKKVIDNIQNMNPKKIIYISCKPSTLKRDIDLLKDYNLKDISIYNMFPCTKHCETICVLERK